VGASDSSGIIIVT